MNLEPGQTIGDYEVLGTLGSGGMGRVYKVRNLISQRVEAIKVLLPDLSAHPELLDRFLREIRISAGLEHPNIASLRSAQRIGDQLLMVMEFVDGATLSSLMQQGRIPLSSTLSYMSQALAALEYAHSHDVIHRDIKPSNMMVTAAGVLKLMDFGVAKISTDSKLTKTGLMVGSLHYLSPEQIEGKEPDGRSDLYALGITFYELATGKRPYDGDSEYQIMSAHLKGAAQPPREMDPSMPASVSDLILTAMARNPESRFGSARAMKAAVDGLAASLNRPAAATAVLPQSVSATPPQRTNRALYILAGSLATVAALAVGLTFVPRYLHTRASNSVPQTHSQPPITPSQTAPPPSTPPPATSSQATQSPASGIPASATKAELPSSEPKPRRLSAPPVHRNDEPVVKTPAAQNPETTAVVSVPPQQQPPPPVPVAAPDLTPIRDQLIQIRARAAAAQNSLDNLQRSQAASGFGLRGDIVAASQHLAMLLSEADGRISAADGAGAQHYLDQAETELEKIEKFLGR